MRSWLTIAALAIFVFAGVCRGSDFDEANRLHDEGKFAEARERYEALIQQGEWTPNLFYNLGTTLYHLKETGHAILNFERALALEHGHAEAKANLSTARDRSGARVAENNWYRQGALYFTANAWSIIAATAGWILLFSLAFLILKRARRPGLYALIVISAGACALAIFALREWDRERQVAIIVSPEAEARVAPADRAALAEYLPAGSRVRVLSVRSDWTYCQLPGSKRGWIPSSALERVHMGET